MISVVEQKRRSQFPRGFVLQVLSASCLLIPSLAGRNASAQTPATLAQSLSLEVAARDKTIVAGQPIVLLFTWRNSSPRDVMLNLGKAGLRNLDISLESEKGESIKPLPNLLFRFQPRDDETKNVWANGKSVKPVPVVFGPWEKIPAAGAYTIIVKPKYSGVFVDEPLLSEKMSAFSPVFRLPITITELDERQLRLAAERTKRKILDSEVHSSKDVEVSELFAYPEQYMMRVWRELLMDSSNAGIGNPQLENSYFALSRVASKRVIGLVSETAWPTEKTTVPYEQTFEARQCLIFIHEYCDSPEAKAEVEKQFRLHEGAWKNEWPGTVRL